MSKRYALYGADRSAEELGLIRDGLAADGYTECAPEELGGSDEALYVCFVPFVEEGRILDSGSDRMDDAFERGYTQVLLEIQRAARSLALAGEAAKNAGSKLPKGRILVVTGGDGQRARIDNFLSGAVNAAMERSLNSIALQLAPFGISVNRISAGVDPRLKGALEAQVRMPMGHTVTPEEVAEAVLAMAKLPVYATGSTQLLDGGYSLSGMPENGEGKGWRQ